MLDAAKEQLATIAGQQPNVRRARKSIANFKLREGMPVGVTRHAARRAHVRDPRPADVGRDPAHPRLPRPQPALVRRPRQLLDGRPRADHLPGDRLRRDRPGARPRRDDHHDRPRPTRRPTRCCASSACRSARGSAGRAPATPPRRPRRSGARRRRAPRAEAEQAALEELKEENPRGVREARAREESERAKRATAAEEATGVNGKDFTAGPPAARTKYKTRNYNRCRRCGRPRAYCASSASAGSACARSPTRA